jgi:methionyl-tRNA formyltransferase
MKIVCMIGPPAYLNYFVSCISEKHELALIIREHTPISKLPKKIIQKGILSSLKIILKKFSTKKQREAEYAKIFGSKWQQMPSNVPVLAVEDINGVEVATTLNQLKPDLILVQGTRMISAATLAQMPLVLNLHWGLSPYYKGSYCTEWAILQNDLNNIGFTIHQISSKIDEGDILTQERVKVEPADSVNLINMKLTRNGARAMTAVVQRIKRGETPRFEKQNYSEGNVYLTKHWTKKKQVELKAIETTGFEKLLQEKHRAELPIKNWASKN